MKVVEFFAPHPDVTADSSKGLRVSRYFGDEDNPAQLRFSVWSPASVDAAISLTEEEATRLANFIAPIPTTRKPILDQIRASLRL